MLNFNTDTKVLLAVLKHLRSFSSVHRTSTMK